MQFSGVMVPIELLIGAVVGLGGAVGGIWRRYDKLSRRSISKRDAAVILREALREQEPERERLSYSDTSDILDVEYNKDAALVRSRSMRPPPPQPLPPRQQRRVARYVRGEDPSTPPDPEPIPKYRGKAPSRSNED